MNRRPSSDAMKLVLVGFLCASLACATSQPARAFARSRSRGSARRSSPSRPTRPRPPGAKDRHRRQRRAARRRLGSRSGRDPDAAKPDDTDPGQKKKPQTVAQRRRQNQIARRAEAALESMIIGTVIGAQFGPIGAAAGAGMFSLWGVITGDVPFEGGRRNAPASRPRRRHRARLRRGDGERGRRRAQEEAGPRGRDRGRAEAPGRAARRDQQAGRDQQDAAARGQGLRERRHARGSDPAPKQPLPARHPRPDLRHEDGQGRQARADREDARRRPRRQARDQDHDRPEERRRPDPRRGHRLRREARPHHHLPARRAARLDAPRTPTRTASPTAG